MLILKMQDERACFDLRRYRAFQFEMLAPVGSYALFTLTQMSADCRARVEPGDSEYIPMSRYYTTPGQWQTVTMHFSDFAENTEGKPFDFEHLKDWTMVNMLPLGQPFQFRNMRLLGGPFGCDGYTSRKFVSLVKA